MKRAVATTVTATSVGDLDTLAASFRRCLRASGRSPRTVTTYLEAVDQLVAFLAAHGMPTDAAKVRREHIEAYLVELQDHGRKPATLSNRFRALQQFFGFLLDEGEIAASLMARMSRPRIPEQPVAVLSEDDLKALLDSCATKSFEDVRDEAIIRLLVDTACDAPRSSASPSRTSVHVWHGDLDRMTVIESGIYQADEIPHATLHRLPLEGHWLMYNHFDEILDRLTE